MNGTRTERGKNRMQLDTISGAALLVIAAFTAPAHAATLFGLVNTGEIYASANGGATWTGRAVLPVRDAIALVAGVTSNDLLLATESGSVYRSTDAGTSWIAVGAVPANDVTALVASNGRSLLVARSGRASGILVDVAPELDQDCVHVQSLDHEQGAWHPRVG